MKLDLHDPIMDPLLFENRIVCEWLNTNEAAQYLRVTANAIRILVCRGKLKYFKYGRLLRFRKDDLKSLLKKGI